MKSILPKIPRSPALIFALSTAAIAAGCLFFYLQQARQIKREESAKLSRIAEFKAGQIVNWRQDRLGDATAMVESPFFHQAISTLLREPGNGRLKRDISKRLEAIRLAHRYADVMVVGRDGRTLISLSPGHDSLCEKADSLAQRVMASGRPEMSDLHFCPFCGKMHIDMMAPVAENAKPPIALMVWRIDPQVYLFPLIQAWPLPSASAENLLVERQGDSLVFLNELRHRKGTALRLWLPLSDTLLPAARAALGRTGIVSGTDYRGERVLADVRPVPGTPWFMVSKVDEEELFARLRFRAWLIALLGLFTLGAGHTGIMAAWNRRQQEHFRELSRLQEERLALSEHYKHLSRYANDMVLLVREDSTIVEANDRALQAYGYSPGELIGKKTRELRIAAEREKLDGQILGARESGGALFETVQQRKNGEEFPVEVSLRPMAINGATYYQGIIRDITERKRYEAELKKLNRELAAIRKCNQTLIRAVQEDRLLDQICRIVVEEAGYPFVWVGYAGQGPEKTVKPMAYNGRESGYLKSLKVTWDDSEHGRGPTGTAIRTGKTCLNRDTASNPGYGPWRERALAHGFHSSIALPLAYGATVYGALNIYADRPDAFSDAEVGMLEELAGDIGYGIAFLRNARARAEAMKELEEKNAVLTAANEELQASEEEIRAAEEELRVQLEELVASQEKLQRETQFSSALLRHTSAYFVAMTPEFKVIMMNPAMLAALGCSEDEVKGRNYLEAFVPPEDRGPLGAVFQEIVDKGKTTVNVNRIISKDGRQLWVEWYGTPINDTRGKVEYFFGLGTDITERKRAEDRLKASEVSYRRLFEAAKDGILIVDAETGKIEDANPFIEELLGYPREELIGKELWQIGSFGDIASCRNNFIELQEKGYIRYEDLPLQTKDGRTRDVEFISSVYTVGDRKVIQCNIRDITDRKRAEETLRSSENKYRTLADNSPDLIARFDRQCRYLYVNPAAANAGRLSPEEYIGKSIAETGVPEAEARKWEGCIREVFETGRTIDVEDAFETPAGKRIFNTKFVPEFTTDDTVASVQSLARDITELKRSEETLRDSEERFHTFFENTFVGIYRITPDGRILMANPALVRMLGYASFEEFSRSSPKNNGYQNGYDRAEFEKLLAKGDQVIGLEAKWTRKDGTTLWVRENARVVRDPLGKALFYEGTVEDISRQKRVEAERAQMEDELRQSQKMEAVGQLAGGVAHDFNNMLAGILGNAEILFGKLADRPELAKMAEQIISGAEHAAKLTKQLLTFSRKGGMKREQLDIHLIIGETVGILANTIDRRISLEQHLKASPSTVLGDQSQLENALLNLGLNSRDAMPDGGRLIFSTELTDLDKEYIDRHRYKITPGRYIKIEVTDTGCGISPDAQARIFEPFFTTKEPGKGTGLGLASAYGAVKSHGGSIECYSEPGHGTTMKIYLPVYTRNEKAEKAIKVEKEMTPGGQAGKLILVVDDEEIVRGMTKQILQGRGCEVLTANDGEEAVRVYQARHKEIDLVILDMIMPRMSGREAYLEMKKIDPDVRAVLSSGFSEDGEAREVLKLGIKGFVQKPFKVADLLSVINEAMS